MYFKWSYETHIASIPPTYKFCISYLTSRGVEFSPQKHAVLGLYSKSRTLLENY